MPHELFLLFAKVINKSGIFKMAIEIIFKEEQHIVYQPFSPVKIIYKLLINDCLINEIVC